MNVVNDTNHIKPKPALFSPRPVVNPPAKQRKLPRWLGCCGGGIDCIVMGSKFSQAHHQATSELEQQVADLETEVQRQRELKAIYIARLETAQNYLRHCLQIAEDNGILHLISDTDKDDHQHQNHHDLAPNMVELNKSSRIPDMISHNTELAAIVNQAKTNGWYIKPHEIELQEKIGQGTTADIYRGSWRGFDVAVKCMYPEFFVSNEGGVAFFVQELETLSRQRHPYVLRLMGACIDPPENGWLVTEIFSMTLKEWLHGEGDRKRERTVPLPPLKESIAKALEIAQAMQYLHDQRPKVVHRDLKPSNIFLDEAMHIRVADFGHARFLLDGKQALTGETGTYIYMAPEVIRGEPYNEKCDVYSFAIILNELLTGQHPYIETDYGPAKIALEVGECKLRPTLPRNDDQLQEVINLIRSSWDGDASVRPSFAMITCTLRKVHENMSTP